MDHTVVPVTSRQLEDRISAAELRLQQLLPGIEAEFRCQICHRLAADHKDGNVRGCNRAKLVDQEYIDDLHAQMTRIEQAVSMAEKLDDFSAMEAELVSLRSDMDQLESEHKQVVIELDASKVNLSVRDKLIKNHNKKVFELVSSLYNLYKGASQGTVDLQTASDEFVRIKDHFASSSSHTDFPELPKVSTSKDNSKSKRSSVRFVDSPTSSPSKDGQSQSGADRPTGSNRQTRPTQQTDGHASASQNQPRLSDRNFPNQLFPAPIDAPSSSNDDDDGDDDNDDNNDNDDDGDADQVNAGPPGLNEPVAGRLIVHSYGGAVCGGSPNSRECKNSKYYITVKFLSSDKPTQHMRKEKKILSQMRSHYSSSSLYTLVDILRKQSPEIDHILEPMVDQEGVYTSFKAFMTDLRSRRFPNIHTACYTEYSELKQGDGTAYELYLDMLGLLQNMGRDPNQCTHDYIGKLKHEAVRNALSTASYSDNNLQILAAHADKVERTLGLIGKDGGKKKKPNGDASVSSNRRSSGNQSNANRGQNGGQSRGRGRGNRGGGANGGASGGVGRGNDAANVSSNQATRPKEISEFLMEQLKQLEQWGIPDHCIGCLASDHRYQRKNPTCYQKRCLFCGREFSAKGGHTSARCHQRPKTKSDLKDFWESKKKDKDRTKAKKVNQSVTFDDLHQSATDSTSDSDTE